jgi:hypothetical protein
MERTLHFDSLDSYIISLLLGGHVNIVNLILEVLKVLFRSGCLLFMGHLVSLSFLKDGYVNNLRLETCLVVITSAHQSIGLPELWVGSFS